MIIPARPVDETTRLKALHELHVLDTPSEERFDRLTRIARNAFFVPFAFVNLIDGERQWCKASFGQEPREEVHRDISFCGHTILENKPFIVNDTHIDQRFIGNPLVTEGPKFRSYLGIPLFAEDGSCVGAFCILDVKPRDFTPAEIEIVRDLAAAAQTELNNAALNKSLQAARLAHEAAEMAVKTRKEFMAMVSHEIRTPMNGILGMAEIMAESELTESQRGFLDTIRDCTKTLLALVNDVLDFSKIESGKLDLEKIAFDPRAAVKQAFALHRQAAANKGLALETEIAPEVPVTVQGDPLRVGQILLNLVGNALKFTATGRITVEVDVVDPGPESSPLLRFQVRDTGVGISPEGQQRLFQAFGQADCTVSRKFGGTGLGLMICKQLVELMGGTIGVKSTQGEGSTFFFTIAYPRTPLAQEAPAAEKIPAAVSALPQVRLLVAEDNLVNQRVLAFVLKKMGLTAEFVSGGLDCLKRVGEDDFDVVLMDVQMPDLDGLETSRRIRALPHRDAGSPWIVAVTADAMPETRQECLSFGMNDYVSKPIREESLRQALARYAERKSLIGSS